MDALKQITDRAVGIAGAVHRRLLGPRRHTGPLPFVGDRPTTNPIFPVDDMVTAVAFYERLGFDVRAYDEQYAWVRHCGWEWFHLRLVDSVVGNEAGAYLHVDDADAWRAGMQAGAGDTVELSPCSDMPWGLREYSFADPSGNTVRIGHHL